MPPKDQPPTAVAAAAEPEAGASHSFRTGYLELYNAASAAAWGAVLSRTLIIAADPDRGPGGVFDENGDFTKWVQTGALLEVMHSLFGVVRAPLSSTLMQVASRILLTWGIGEHFPDAAQHWAYTTMLVAWSVTEVIRYSYFAININGDPPRFLTWLRYNTFFVLYPLGISSECWLISRAREPAAEVGAPVVWALWAILAVYVPGAYYLYTYMIAQRRKVMRALAEKKKA